MNIKEILELIKEDKYCKLLPKMDSNELKKDIPNDLEYFFSNYGGIEFFKNKPYGIKIIGNDEFVNANIFFYPKDDVIWEELEGDISNDWFIIAKKTESSQYISIDLNKERAGYCYDSFLEIHSDPDFSPIIATSFTELLALLFKAEGKSLFWLEEGFESKGKAYD